ncbi:bifunctional [glutamine synthetase] adenylyltransferase/[glutamine synthetase]-adenylyl-L-tyrosine phosphorylase [Tepidamorphus sp. 3E244]|uniref:bifunctional [glutamine synthetase] adenylyltransferase/[glutamine synthetase]-adenylyl-L-tyrosine phosphorylase n=1 Tax=Tepidamorphus sp. 3E244 TaxID=3385498 RepID=UPI0038FC3016
MTRATDDECLSHETPLKARFNPVALPPPQGGDRDHFADVVAAADGEATETLEALPQAVRDGLKPVLAGSPYIFGLCLREPTSLAETMEAAPGARLDALQARAEAEMREAADMAAAMKALRRYKNDAALLIALADIGGAFPLLVVTCELTRIADAALQLSIDWLLRRAATQGKFIPADPDQPSKGSGLIVLAMGKHGARELNFSSDIDIIVFYETFPERLKDPADAPVFFVRLTRDLVKLMQERTADGYVFRTDLRLRPDPGATAVAISVPGALNYYESLGQNWERAAMIKARACAGDIPAGEGFIGEIRPFVWRKYMDFAAIADTQAMKRQIHRHKGHGKIAVAGHNIKLGRGGIREIEFFAQTQQLIGGGRDPHLRTRATLEALDALVDAGWIDASVRDDLEGAYDTLRTIEHRLQQISDEQTHTLPSEPDALARFAAFCGFETVAALEEKVIATLKIVEYHYANLFESAESLSDAGGSLVFTGDSDDPETVDTLQRMKFEKAPEVIAAIRGWHFGRFPATRSTRSRELLTELTPRLLETVGHTQNPDATFIALDRFIRHLPAGVQIFSLLRANPQLLDMLVEILGAAPRLAETLSRRPRLIDALIDPAFSGTLPDRAAFTQHLDRVLGEAGIYEETLDQARAFGQEQMALIGARMLTGSIPPEAAAEGYTALADALLERLHVEAAQAFVAQHGRVAGGNSALVAMGRLGGREMTATSDIDLILIYDADEDARESDGKRPLATAPYYVRLAQRLISAISAQTAFGSLYEVDMRLRPSGQAGMLATRIDSFEQYQAKEAWTWEHMALTKARVLSGKPDLKARIESCIHDVLCSPRDTTKIARDVRDMRERIHREKGSDDIWHVKAVRGGITDVEFIAQYLALVHADAHPQVLAVNTQATLAALKDAGVLSGDDAEALMNAGALYARILQVLRVSTGGAFDPAAAPRGLQGLLAKVTDEPSFDRLAPRLEKTQAEVIGIFDRLIPPSADGD